MEKDSIFTCYHYSKSVSATSCMFNTSLLSTYIEVCSPMRQN